MNPLSVIRRLLISLKLTRVGVIINIPRRIAHALRYYVPKVPKILAWGFRSREDTNYTYDLSDNSLFYLAHTLAVVTGTNVSTAQRYIEEARADVVLKATVIDAVRNSKFRSVSDARCEFGRRLGWYALTRILKPHVVIETGVDKGYGAILLCAALLRNRVDGVDGKYYGTDINPEAGWILRAPYAEVGTMLFGDSIQSLATFPYMIDLFINDSDHSAEYEYREYKVIAARLTERAIVLADNAHATPMLAQFAAENEMDFVYFHEVPREHWYPGAGIGIAFKRRSAISNAQHEANTRL